MEPKKNDSTPHVVSGKVLSGNTVSMIISIKSIDIKPGVDRVRQDPECVLGMPAKSGIYPYKGHIRSARVFMQYYGHSICPAGLPVSPVA